MFVCSIQLFQINNKQKEECIMKEKALYINLPDGASYRRVEVTADGRICIIYTEQYVSKEKSIEEILTGTIPKPIPLIGGTEVYQKDNGTPYWYCKIKEGRDEFMHVYFEDLTEKDLLYDANGKKRKFVTPKQKMFETNVKEVLKSKPKEGYRWLPVYEPSENSNGNLCYIAGAKVFQDLNAYQWYRKLEQYSPENGSKQATYTTYFLLLLRWLKDGIATIEQLADDSTEIGHYRYSKDAKIHQLEKTGDREFGGLYGFVGNTNKIVRTYETELDFSLIGGNYCAVGSEYPLARVRYGYNPEILGNIGLLELTK